MALMEASLPRHTGLAPLPALPENVTPETIARLARDVAMNIHELNEILPTYGLDEAQFNRIAGTAFYQQLWRNYLIEWNSPLSAEKRIKLGAQSLLEAAMPGLGAGMCNIRQPLKERVDAAKLFARLGDVDGDRKSNASDAEKFVINISFGKNNRVNVVTELAPKPPEPLVIDAEPGL